MGELKKWGCAILLIPIFYLISFIVVSDITRWMMNKLLY